MARSRHARWGFGLLALAWAAGCGPRDLALSAGDAPDAVPSGPYGRLAVALSRVRAEDGVDYARLAADPAPLDAFLRQLADWGPRTAPHDFADRPAALAYVLNAYNALMLRSVLEVGERGAGPPRRLPADLESRYRVRIDGRPTTAAELRREARRWAANDWRVGLALCPGRAIGPPLPPRPFLPDLLDAQLDEAVRRAVAADGVVRVDHGVSKRLRVWSGLYAERARLVADYEARHRTRGAVLLNVLLEWSDRPRRAELNAAVGYAEAPLPDDGLSNARPPAAATARRGLGDALRSIREIRFVRPDPPSGGAIGAGRGTNPAGRPLPPR